MEPFQKLEHKFGEWVRWGKPSNMVVCSSGTAALHLALESLTLPKNGVVLVPDFTMVACARAVTMAGLVPMFVDCWDDLRMDIGCLEEAIARSQGRAVAVMPVHVYGRRCDMDAIYRLAVEHDLYVIEDMAEAHGVPVHPGSDAACWSFYRNKIVAGEEGGALILRHDESANHARRLRSLGFTELHDYDHVPRGHNYRLANCLAEKILNSLDNVDINLRARRWFEALYTSECPPGWTLPYRDAPWVYDIRIPGLTRPRQAKMVQTLNKAGIAARFGFKPMSSQEEYSTADITCENDTNGVGRAAVASREVIYLPLQPDVVNPEQVSKSFEIIKSVMGEVLTKNN